MKNKPIPELALTRECFNLFCEEGEDPLRLAKEAEARELERKAAREYQERMQRTFEQCPGFMGGDVPSGEGKPGRIVVDPRLVSEAMPWLKRRFHVKAELELATSAEGLVVELMTRIRAKSGGQKIPVKWNKVEQFKLEI